MSDWFIATEGVKIVKDSSDLMTPVLTGLTSAAAALGGVALTHYFTRKREDAVAAKKNDSELLFIATELIFVLEMFAEECARVASDLGEPDQQGEYRPTTNLPEFVTTNITGDWRMLPPLIMYRIRELPILENEARRYVAAFSDHAWEPPFHTEVFRERIYHYTRLGLKALILSRRLRQMARLPGTRLDASEWSAQPVLWGVWRKERNLRAMEKIQRQKYEIPY
ncbi:hypothetical protein M8O33_21980 [Enterobacter bugandensis]|uniref:hypothetical protein n=1 Tax=Enterobacter bugandensis TaxID=881260 RepID=UPI0020758AFA|nr:hypothetical protein [Enterobacter bugandensis]MCM7280135.1 hypothetical protein [Enterobacter bugandensis]